MVKHRFVLALPLHIWEAIKALAARQRRPITQEIIIAIEKHLGDNEDDVTQAVDGGNAP